MIRIAYRFLADPAEQPSQTEVLPASLLEETVSEINRAGGVVLESRPIHWSETLSMVAPTVPVLV